MSVNAEPAAMITGASRGIGRAAALALSRAGYRTVLLARSQEALNETAEKCVEAGGIRPLVCSIDLQSQISFHSCVEKALSAAGRLDVLVNNAGAAISKSFDSSTPSDWDALMNLNARAPFFLTQAALPALRQSPAGVIINIGSVVSVKGYENQSVYTASKHALAGWTKTLAKEVAKDGIRVHLITPGGVATDMVRQMRPDIDEADLIQSEEIAEAIMFLVRYRGNAVIDVLDLHRAGKLPFS